MAKTILICKIDGCNKLAHDAGMCRMHYQRKRAGNPMDAPEKTRAGAPMAFVLAALAAETDDCIFWPFSTVGGRYGKVFYQGKLVIVSRLVCELAHGAAPGPWPGIDAAHSCGNGVQGCINPRHLRWDTSKGNHADMTASGTRVRGAKCWNAKLAASDVVNIRRRLALGETQTRLGADFGVSSSSIGDIANFKTWGWLK